MSTTSSLMEAIDRKEIWSNISERRDVDISDTLRVELAFPRTLGNVQNVTIYVNRYGESPGIVKELILDKQEEKYVSYFVDLNFEMYGNYFFFFKVNYIDEHTVYRSMALKISRETNKPTLMPESQESPYWVVFVRYDNSDVPEWAKDTVYYQIFVDRFYRSESVDSGHMNARNYRSWGEMPNWHRNERGKYHNNDFFCGNIRGVEEKLEYLKSLGVGVIYLSPINESLYRYDRYASTDHMKIDPDAGDFEDLRSLHQKASELGMHIVLDIALNHCSSDNPIFQEALHNPQSRFRDWFFFDENNGYRHWFNLFIDMPVFNQKNREFQEYVYGEDGIIDVFSKYVDGFRLDVAEELKPWFIHGIRERANSNGKHIIIGECWFKVSLDMLGNALDTTTNYVFSNAMYKYVVDGDITGFIVEVMSILDSYPQNTIDTMLNSLDTHDMVRALTILGGKNMKHSKDRIWDIDYDPSPWHYDAAGGRKFDTDGFRQFEFDNDVLDDASYAYAKKLIKVCSIILYFLPGCPCMYYGTEVGLHGYKDPFNRKTFPWDSQDEELLSFFRSIFEFRNQVKLAGSTFKVLDISTKCLMFTMTNEANSVLVVVSRDGGRISVDVPQEYADYQKCFIHNATSHGSDHCYDIDGYGGVIIVK